MSPQQEDDLSAQTAVNLDQVSIALASPESIRAWSHGEVKNPEMINYRTFKPEKGGLFCERIFGPVRDWECACGKYKRIKHKGVVCDRCHVAVTLARVRRERMGHIELAVPVSHIWFHKGRLSPLGLMLDLTAKQLERVIYYEDYIVIDAGNTMLDAGQLLNETEFREAEEQYGEEFTAGMGAEALQKLLERIDLAKLLKDLQEQMEKTKSKTTKTKLVARLKLAQGFLQSRTRPEWMTRDVLPVLPPDLRPFVLLEGGRFASADLNDHYRRVINRNNWLKNLLQLKTPEVIIRNEKRTLQEAIDALFDNGRHGRVVTGASNRPLKSLSDVLEDHLREQLRGKRVDYSGRSVIVPGPELKLNQCGLPKKMALVLFEPFIIRRLKELGYVHTVRSAKKIIERQEPVVWDILEEVTKGHPVLLNRAPTLHRLSIQAFEPQLIEGEAIRIHPLVCTAYNADFDGDQMAVHVPLSAEAQLEARMLMLATNNIFSPSSGKPITTPSQDITLGCYYLTQNPRITDKNRDVRLPLFADSSEVELALSEDAIKTHTRILYKNPDLGKQSVYGDPSKKVIETTAGRVRFNEIWPEGLGFINKPVGKKQLSEIIWNTYQVGGQKVAVETLDRLKDLGFREATRAGISIGIVDMIIPKEKQLEIDRAHKQIDEVEKQYRKGIITDGERYNKIIDIWTHAGEEISNVMFRTLDHNEGRKEMNPVFLMVDSGARGNRQQVKQLAGMPGLMAKPSGEIIERPITSNFREGLTVHEWFMATFSARKVLCAFALSAAESGYLARKLVAAVQDVIITEQDCGTVKGIVVQPIYEGDEEVVDLKTRTFGRTSCETIYDPVGGKTVIKAGHIIDEETAKALEHMGVEQLRIRSVLTCESRRGCCAKCYGRNLANGKQVDVGEAVGIIAAQSVAESGMQVSRRMACTVGLSGKGLKRPIITAKSDGTVRYVELRTAESTDGNNIVLNKNGFIGIHNNKDGREVERHSIVIGSVISVADGGKVKKGDVFVQWDPYNIPILAERPGSVEFRDMIPGLSVKREVDEVTGSTGLLVTESQYDLCPQIVVVDDEKKVVASYLIPVGTHIAVADNRKVEAGQLLAKTPRNAGKTKDITGGLSRVVNLLEAREPKESAEIAKIDGIVSIQGIEYTAGVARAKRRLLVLNVETREQEEHLIPLNKNIIVAHGDRVRKGSQLTEGLVLPREILQVCGPAALQEHLLNEVQEVYRLQGVETNDKHIEIIIRQMLRKVKITDPGDTTLLSDDKVDRSEFDAGNKSIIKFGGKSAEGEPVMLGLSDAVFGSASFVSAASSGKTAQVLTDAAAHGAIDRLSGCNESVTFSCLVPVGTGFGLYRGTEISEAFDTGGLVHGTPMSSELPSLEIKPSAILCPMPTFKSPEPSAPDAGLSFFSFDN